MDANFTLGARGEHYVARRLTAMGMEVEWPGGPSDLVIGGNLAVEVKSARLTGKDGGRSAYQFCLRRTVNGRVKTDHRKAAVVILNCYRSNEHKPIGSFIIPSGTLGARKQVSITSRFPHAYQGQWSRFYENWSVLEDGRSG